MKRVLVTGGSGFIGRHCLSHLRSAELEIHATTRRHEPPRVPGVVWHRVDLLNGTEVEQMLEALRPDQLLHLAWITAPGAYWHAVDNLEWLQSSLTLVRAAASRGLKRMVIAGTCAEYDWTYGYCSEARTPLAPSSLYGTTKHALHSLLEAWLSDSDLELAWARIFFLYGPGEPESKLVSSAVRSLRSQGSFAVRGAHLQRDYLFVDDVAAALTALLRSRVCGAVNIGSGTAPRLGDIVAEVVRQLGGTALPLSADFPAERSQPQVVLADVRRLRDEVQWRPAVDLSEGVRRVISHLKATE